LQRCYARSGRIPLMTNWTSRLCEANGINIRYLRTVGSKPPLVLLHGLTGNGACCAHEGECARTGLDEVRTAEQPTVCSPTT
jgi:hypothetical protein